MKRLTRGSTACRKYAQLTNCAEVQRTCHRTQRADDVETQEGQTTEDVEDDGNLGFEGPNWNTSGQVEQDGHYAEGG